MRCYAKLLWAKLMASVILLVLGGVAIAGPIETSSPAVQVPLKKEGGTFVVPVLINGAITLDFLVDSGAADVSVPADVFSTLMRTGTIRNTDLIGEQTYVLADGSKRRAVMFTIRSLKVGDEIIENVRGSVAPSMGTLLLGQSFLERFKSWSINNTRHTLLLELQTARTPSDPTMSAPAQTVIDKAAIQKMCSDQASTRGLHGAARWEFRDDCKKKLGLH